MRAYSMDLREKIVSAMEEGGSSVRKVAARFKVGKNLVQKLVRQNATSGHVRPGKQGGSMVSPILQYQEQLVEIVAQHHDATLAEYCELLADKTDLWVSTTTMFRTLARLNLTRKKKHFGAVKPKQSVSRNSDKSIGSKSKTSS